MRKNEHVPAAGGRSDRATLDSWQRVGTAITDSQRRFVVSAMLPQPCQDTFRTVAASDDYEESLAAPMEASRIFIPSSVPYEIVGSVTVASNAVISH